MSQTSNQSFRSVAPSPAQGHLGQRALAPHLVDVLAKVEAALGNRPERPKAERLRDLADCQIRQARAHLYDVARRRRWIGRVSEINPGLVKFYGLTPQRIAQTLNYAKNCRRRAAEALAEARALEIAA